MIRGDKPIRGYLQVIATRHWLQESSLVKPVLFSNHNLRNNNRMEKQKITINPNKKIGRECIWIKNSRPLIHYDSHVPNANKCNIPFVN